MVSLGGVKEHLPMRFQRLNDSRRSPGAAPIVSKVTGTGWQRLVTAFMTLCCGIAAAATTDLSYPPTTSSGHDFNHSPVGQSFTATATNVRGGIYLADEDSFTAWLATVYPGQITPGSYPYAVAPTVSVRLDLLLGEGTGSSILSSTTQTLTAPFNGVVETDFGAAGIALTVGQKYTLLLTDVSSQAYPLGVTGWVIPAVHDASTPGQPVLDANGATVGYLPYGAYYGGQPILQGSVVANDAGIGDNAFEVIDNTPPVQTVSGSNAVITAYVARNPGFIVINGGLNLLDHLWTTDLNPGNTVFLGGLVNWYQTGLLVDYAGIVTSQGVVLTSLTVKPAPAPLVGSAASLPTGTIGIAYQAPLNLTVSGGLAPYQIGVSGLPPGLTSDGVNVTGTPTTAGAFTVSIAITDVLGHATSTSASITINAPPPPPSTNYTLKDEGKGSITALGNGYLMVGTKRLIWDAKTALTVNTPQGDRHVIDGSVKVGMKAQWKGLRDKNTNTVLTSQLEVN